MIPDDLYCVSTCVPVLLLTQSLLLTRNPSFVCHNSEKRLNWLVFGQRTSLLINLKRQSSRHTCCRSTRWPTQTKISSTFSAFFPSFSVNPTKPNGFPKSCRDLPLKLDVAPRPQATSIYNRAPAQPRRARVPQSSPTKTWFMLDTPPLPAFSPDALALPHPTHNVLRVSACTSVGDGEGPTACAPVSATSAPGARNSSCSRNHNRRHQVRPASRAVVLCLRLGTDALVRRW
ncbi:hypothetical protein EI94DRAFT_1724141 [Lactarius quietus]|nr:hypothetical protein EI94DRAFT_1724141 [Lactarius quietus]